MKSFKKLFLSLSLAVVLMATLSACNTVEGIGQDARAAGQAISNAASGSKGY